MLSTYVDIVTISRNSDSVILKTLESVSSQRYDYINHIIVDGKSTDKSLEVIHNFSHKKKIYIHSQLPLGISNAFNTGLSKSCGELVIFLNSGDRFVNDSVVKQIVDSYHAKSWLWAVGETISVSRRGYLKRYVRQHNKWEQKLFWYRNPICHQSTIFSRKLIEQVGLYNEQLSLGMDYDFNIRCSLVSDPLLLYFPISYYDTCGVSSRRVFRSYLMQSEIRKKYFPLSITRNLIIESIGFLKALQRFLMIPIKFFL
ncbi:glycosyltransferase [Nodularia spumigena CS-591/12]|uniref:glycosyltransferase n=1 Tax=Nodularia spumigena TaxID=70799 RepID=UPI00232B70B2|nr:glycosyltransferase [Nodularia spumigena]MDB9303326.1 glycosyltransferase [Nodularia spumigena CS-591/12]MDB9347611.1 glycosyltransferase [Nodularia spumigena CS-588/01]MDB9353809.1 glycosyltransferase [Nodularia spumigena CS-588/05]